MENQISFKELYNVSLKTTYPIEINGRVLQSGETIAAFDRILISDFQEKKNFWNAKGGYDNRSHVWWEETKEVRFSLIQGVFSKTTLALMTNASLASQLSDNSLPIGCIEKIETDEGGAAATLHPISEPVFVYDVASGERITDYSIEGNSIITGVSFQELMVDYQYQYNYKYSVFTIGRSLTNGYLSLEGRTRVKDDITGQVTTGIIKIPKLKLMSNLSMRLGQDAVPLVGRLDAVAVPTGERGNKEVMRMIFLDEDIDSDM